MHAFSLFFVVVALFAIEASWAFGHNNPTQPPDVIEYEADNTSSFPPLNCSEYTYDCDKYACGDNVTSIGDDNATCFHFSCVDINGTSLALDPNTLLPAKGHLIGLYNPGLLDFCAFLHNGDGLNNTNESPLTLNATLNWTTVSDNWYICATGEGEINATGGNWAVVATCDGKELYGDEYEYEEYEEYENSTYNNRQLHDTSIDEGMKQGSYCLFGGAECGEGCSSLLGTCRDGSCFGIDGQEEDCRPANKCPLGMGACSNSEYCCGVGLVCGWDGKCYLPTCENLLEFGCDATERMTVTSTEANGDEIIGICTISTNFARSDNYTCYSGTVDHTDFTYCNTGCFKPNGSEYEYEYEYENETQEYEENLIPLGDDTGGHRRRLTFKHLVHRALAYFFGF